MLTPMGLRDRLFCLTESGEGGHCRGGVDEWPGGGVGQGDEARVPRHPVLLLVSQLHQLRQRLADILRMRPAEVQRYVPYYHSLAC